MTNQAQTEAKVFFDEDQIPSDPKIYIAVSTKRHGLAMVRWLRARSVLAYYSPSDGNRGVLVFVTKHGRESTHELALKAFAETKV